MVGRKTKKRIVKKNKSNESTKRSTKRKTLSRKQTDVINIINKKEYQKMEYPYYSQTITKKELANNLKQLRNYKPNVLSRNPTREKIRKFNNRFIIFKENYYQNKELYNITDYFSQTCRAKCIYNLNNSKSPLDYFTENKDDIYNAIIKDKKQKKIGSNTITHLDLTEHLYRKVKQCTLFNTTIVISLLKLFKPKRYLDPSSGWGDRLIGAIAYGCEYTGVDPSQCMNPIYKKIIKSLVPESRQNKYRIIQDGFENVVLEDDYYDLVFTSPPFFDLEIYENKKAQSMFQFNSLEKWLNGFLYPLILKSSVTLRNKGYLALYINDYTNVKFTHRMVEFVKTSVPAFKDLGHLHFWDQTNPKTIRRIFVWQKKTKITL